MNEPTAAPIRLAAGVVSFGDGPRVAAAVRSLVAQRLPEGAAWTEFWIVVSPGSDGTVEIARMLAVSDPRIHVVEEPRRRGKSAALAEVLARASGDFLVLLNGDAVAGDRAVEALLAARPGRAGPFAVMARPTPAPRTDSLLARTVGLLWELHHDFHVEILQRGSGTHLSDEMMLLPVAHLPRMQSGVVNDGAYIAQQTAQRGGTLAYASAARVQITTPASWRQHVSQRRRIARGHRQVRELTGSHPTTLPRFALDHPRRALEIVIGDARARRGGWLALFALIVGEFTVYSLAWLDDVRGVRTPAAWSRSSPAPRAALLLAAADDGIAPAIDPRRP